MRNKSSNRHIPIQTHTLMSQMIISANIFIFDYLNNINSFEIEFLYEEYKEN